MVDHIAVPDGRTNIDDDGFEQTILVYNYNMMMTHNRLDPGAESPYHAHPHEQIGYVLRGEAIQIVDGEEYPLSAGTSYRLEPGEKHAMRTVGDEPFEVLDIFHPVREDYLPE